MQNWPCKENRTCNRNNLVIVPTVSLPKKPTLDSSLPNSVGNENPQGLTALNGSKIPPQNSNLITLLEASAETTNEDSNNNNNVHATLSKNNTEPRKTCCDTNSNSEPHQTILSTSIINLSSDSDNGNTSLIDTPQALEKENKEANSSAELISESSPDHTSASWATNFLMSVGAVQIKPLKLNLSTKKKEKPEERALNLPNTKNASSQNKKKETLSKIPTLTNLSYTSCTQAQAHQVNKDTTLTDNLDHYIIKSRKKPGNFNDNYTCDIRHQLHVPGGPIYPEQIPLPGNSTSYIRSIETNLFHTSVPMNHPNYLPQSNETHSAQSSIPNVYPNYHEGHTKNIETSSEKRFTSSYKIPKLSSRNTSVASSRSLSRSSTESRVVEDNIDRYNEFAIESYEAAMQTRRRRPEDYLEQKHTKIRKLNDGKIEKRRETGHEKKKAEKSKDDKNRVDSGKPKDKNREVNLLKTKDKSRSLVKYKSRSLRTSKETASNKSETDHKTKNKKSHETSSTTKKSSEKHRSTEERKAHKLTKISSKRQRHSSESTSDSPRHSVEKKICTTTSRKNLSLNKNAKSLKVSHNDVNGKKSSVRSIDKISKSKRGETQEHTIKSVVKKMVREKALSLLRNQNKKEYEELKSIKKKKTTTDSLEDSREKLSHRTLNDYFTACLNQRNYQPTRTERDNLIITVDNEEDVKTPELESPDASNKRKKKVSKSKKNKKIKVVINIKCDNDDKSSNESDDSEEKDSDKSDLDLSFLDLDVDDIVSCLQNCSNVTDNEANEDKIKPESIESLYTNKTKNIQSTPFSLKEKEPEDFLLESKDELAGIKYYLNNVSTSPEASLTCDNFESSKIHSRYPSNETLILEHFDEEAEEESKANIRPMIRVKTVTELNTVEYSVQENNTQNTSEFINVYENKHNICVKTETKVATSNYINVQNDQSTSVETIIIDLDSPRIEAETKVATSNYINVQNDQSTSVETIIIDLDSPRIEEKVTQTDKPLSPTNVCAQDTKVIDLINGEASNTGIPHKVTDNKTSEENIMIDLTLDDISSEEYRTITSQVAANDMNKTDDIVKVSDISVKENNVFDTEIIKDTELAKNKLSKSQIAISTLDVQELQTKLGEISENKSEIGTIVAEDTLLNLDTEDYKKEVKITEKDNEVTCKDDHKLESKSIVAKEKNETIALDLIGNIYSEDINKEDKTVLEDDPLSKDSETNRIIVDNKDVTEELPSAAAFAGKNDTEKAENYNIMIMEEDKVIVETASFEENGLNNKGARGIEIPINENNISDNADGKDVINDKNIIEVDKSSGDNKIIDSMHKKVNSETLIVEHTRIDNDYADSENVIMKEEDKASEDINNIDRKDIERKIIISNGESIVIEKAHDVMNTNVENLVKETVTEVVIKKEVDEIMASNDESFEIRNDNRIDRRDNTDIERKIIISNGESIVIEKAHDVMNTNVENLVKETVTEVVIKKEVDEIMASKEESFEIRNENRIDRKDNTDIERKIIISNSESIVIEKADSDDVMKTNVENIVKETVSEVVIKKEVDEIMASNDESFEIRNENRNVVSEDDVSISKENNAVIKKENFKATLAENENFMTLAENERCMKKDEDNRVKEFDDKQAMKDHGEEPIRKSDEKGAIRKTSANKTIKTHLAIVKKNQVRPRTNNKTKPSPIAFDSHKPKRKHKPIRLNHYRKIEFKNMLPQDKTFAVKLEERMDDFMQKKFEIMAFIRKGRFSKIYHCKDAAEQDFAVKIIMDRNYRRSFGIDKEDMLMKLQHEIPRENLTFVYLINGFRFQSHWCFLMEYCSMNLWQVLLESKGGLHIDKVQILSRQLVTAVAVLRNNHIVHGEINPSHILLSADNRLKLCGFDCAFHISSFEDITEYSCWPHRSPCFTNYRAPELLMGFKIDYGIDVWTTAMVMLHMATNQTLVTGYNSPNELLFKLQCILGNMPREMVERSKFTAQHFIGRDFCRKYSETSIKLIPRFYAKKNLIHKLVHNAYREDHEQHTTKKQREVNARKLMALASLLEKMLLLHPTDRMPIEFVKNTMQSYWMKSDGAPQGASIK